MQFYDLDMQFYHLGRNRLGITFPNQVPLFLLAISVAQDVASLARSSFACNDYS